MNNLMGDYLITGIEVMLLDNIHIIHSGWTIQYNMNLGYKGIVNVILKGEDLKFNSLEKKLNQRLIPCAEVKVTRNKGNEIPKALELSIMQLC